MQLQLARNTRGGCNDAGDLRRNRRTAVRMQVCAGKERKRTGVSARWMARRSSQARLRMGDRIGRGARVIWHC